MKEYITASRSIASVQVTERLLVYVVGPMAVAASGILAFYVSTQGVREREEQMDHLFMSVMESSNYELALDRDQLNSFAPFSKSGVIVAPQDTTGIRPVLFCLNGVDGGMSALTGDYDGLRVAKDTLEFTREQRMMERCEAALAQYEEGKNQ